MGREATETLFYDDGCGLCRGLVRFARRRRRGDRFDYQPLYGERFDRLVPASVRRRLPDSAVLATRAGEILVRWRMVRRVLAELGGGWRLLGLLAGIVPRALGDVIYALVARLRRRSTPGVCHVAPAGDRVGDPDGAPTAGADRVPSGRDNEAGGAA